MTTSPAITVSNLGKAYRLGSQHTRPKTAVEAFLQTLSAPIRNFKQLYNLTHFESEQDILWALKDVSFEIDQGEVVGIIGRNGAGKSTLLKILSRITNPTKGSAVIHGKLSSLLEVGTGFHPELTGRENIFLNGTILGMTKEEIISKFDAIVDFADITQFLDTPVKRYSSGMYVRLAFSVAAHLEPDILLVDEVLAVGDLHFQKKCLGKMNEVSQKKGRTVVFVSHNMGSIAELCTKVIYMDKGKVVHYGPTNEMIALYLKDVVGADTAEFSTHSHNKKAFLNTVSILDHTHQPSKELDLRFLFSLQITYTIVNPQANLEIAFRIYQSNGNPVFTSQRSELNPDILKKTQQGTFQAAITLPANFLMPGDYLVSAYIHESFGAILDEQKHCLSFTIHDTGHGITRYKDYTNMGCILMPLIWKEVTI